jgi:hypothetical protein
MKTGQHTIRLIGRREFVDFPGLGLNHIEAKVDTGAYTSSLHAENIHLREVDSIPMLFFTVEAETDNGIQKREYAFTNFSKKIIKNSFGEMESRYIIKTLLKIGRKNIRASISLTNRWNMRYQVLIGRKPLKGKFLIDVKQLYLGGQKAGIAISKMNA